MNVQLRTEISALEDKDGALCKAENKELGGVGGSGGGGTKVFPEKGLFELRSKAPG